MRPEGATDQLTTWSGIDLRPDASRLDGGGMGRCLLYLPVPDSNPRLIKIGDHKFDALGPASRALIRSRLGSADNGFTRLDELIADLLMNPPANRWKALRPSRRRRRYEIVLGPKEETFLWVQPLLAGGATFTESFNQADSSTLGPDLTWTEFNGNGSWETLSNEVALVGNTATDEARAESDTDSDDMVTQLDYVTFTYGGGTYSIDLICRKDTTATRTWYMAQCRETAGEGQHVVAAKRIAGSQTDIGSNFTLTLTGKTMKVEADGSAIAAFEDGVSRSNGTDTDITGNTRGGFSAFAQNVGNNFRGDNFEVADLAPAAAAGLFRATNRLTGVGVGGPFFENPLT